MLIFWRVSESIFKVSGPKSGWYDHHYHYLSIDIYIYIYV